jgi:hypothetical protein
LGKSSAPTSPATDRTSPPAALISASTPSKRLASMLRSLASLEGSWCANSLADHDLCSLLSKKDSRSFANALRQNVLRRRESWREPAHT